MTTATRTDRPGRVIAILEEEFEDFQTEATEFLAQNREADDFTKFRLRQGVYGQRQPDRQMMRVKLPFGGTTSEQLEAFAVIAEDFAPLGKGHLTTREAVQLHHLPLADTHDIMQILGASGLSTREACGNTVRNVTGDAWAGIRDDEPFDVTPYAGAFVRYFVRSDLTQLLPRKFKVAFSGSNED
ncbi:MAG: nitrite reductase, partial [Chloroflexi bacterium]|nr:nitrite reductase [Chloroflexota bacterium]